MKGAIIGDIIGSTFINEELSSTDFQLFRPTSAFTDDTVLTLATADSILTGTDYIESMVKWVNNYPDAGYRKEFLQWVANNGQTPYVSGGEGAARRISPIGFAAQSIEEALTEAKKTTMITHNVPVRIEASQAMSVSIYMAKNGATRKEIKSYVSVHFGYDLSLSVDYWKDSVKSKYQLATPVPPAMAAFMEASDFEEAIRLAIYIGGPTSTIACIAGALAQAYFQHIPKAFTKRALARLSPDMGKTIELFEERFLQSSEVI